MTTGSALMSLGQSLNPNSIANALRTFQSIGDNAVRDQIQDIQLQSAKINIQEQQRVQKVQQEQQRLSEQHIQELQNHPHGKLFLKGVNTQDYEQVANASSRLGEHTDLSKAFSSYINHMDSVGKPIGSKTKMFLQGLLDDPTEENMENLEKFLDAGLAQNVISPKVDERDAAASNIAEIQNHLLAGDRAKASEVYQSLSDHDRLNIPPRIQHMLYPDPSQSGGNQTEILNNTTERFMLDTQNNFGGHISMGINGLSKAKETLNGYRSYVDEALRNPNINVEVAGKLTKSLTKMQEDYDRDSQRIKDEYNLTQTREANLMSVSKNIDLSSFGGDQAKIIHAIKEEFPDMSDKKAGDLSMYYLQHEAELAPKLNASKNTREYNRRITDQLKDSMGVKGEHFVASDIKDTLGLSSKSPLIDTMASVFPATARSGQGITFIDEERGNILGFPQKGSDEIIGLYRNEDTGEVEFVKYKTKLDQTEEEVLRSIDFDSVEQMDRKDVMSIFDTDPRASKDPQDHMTEFSKRVLSVVGNKVIGDVGGSKVHIMTQGHGYTSETRDNPLGLDPDTFQRIRREAKILAEKTTKVRDNIGFFEFLNEDVTQGGQIALDNLEDQLLDFLLDTTYSLYERHDVK